MTQSFKLWNIKAFTLSREIGLHSFFNLEPPLSSEVVSQGNPIVVKEELGKGIPYLACFLF